MNDNVQQFQFSKDNGAHHGQIIKEEYKPSWLEHHEYPNSFVQELKKYATYLIWSHNKGSIHEHPIQSSDLLQDVFVRIEGNQNLKMPKDLPGALRYLKGAIKSRYIDIVVRKDKSKPKMVEINEMVHEIAIDHKTSSQLIFERMNNLNSLLTQSKILNEKEMKMWKLLLVGTPRKEIAEILAIDIDVLYTTANRIKKKIRSNISFNDIG